MLDGLSVNHEPSMFLSVSPGRIGMNNPETKDSSVEMIKILFSVFMLFLLKEKSKVLFKLTRPTRKILVYGTHR